MKTSRIEDPSALEIFSTLYPYLQTAAGYANFMQKTIVPLPNKDLDNIFSQALSAADLSVQTFVEVALLSYFPDLAFFGEEHEKSHNTSYFKSSTWHEHPRQENRSDSFLILLDPIDGTRFFLDKHDNFQIILSVLSPEGYEGALFLSPARNEFYYALKGKGLFFGKDLSLPFSSALPYVPPPYEQRILLSSRIHLTRPESLAAYEVFSTIQSYSPHSPSPMGNDIFRGNICGLAYGSSSYIDGGANVFAAQEAGFYTTSLDGKSLPPPGKTQSLQMPPALIGRSKEIVDSLLAAGPAENK
jgi:myo-inositol-1(or 4)-monophosphatase